LPAKSLSSEASSHTPIRVSEETHCTLAVFLNKGADFGLAMGGMKKGSHGAQQQNNREEKLQVKESISLYPAD
jgi:hypothetical protein